MAEENGQQGQEGQGEGQQQQGQQGDSSNVSKYVGANGELLEGWREGLVDENLRGDTVYDKVTDVQGLTRQLSVLDKQVGKKGVIIPGETASEAEINAYHEAIGVPKTPEDYASLMKRPEKMPKEYWDEALNKEARVLFHKLGLTPKQASSIMEFDNLRTMAGIESNTADDERALRDAEDAFTAEQGNAKEATIHLMNRFVSEATKDWSEEDKVKLFGTDELPGGMNSAEFAPLKNLFIKLLAAGGKKFLEHHIIDPVDPRTLVTPAQAEAKMKELIATKGYADSTMLRTDPGQYNRLTKEIAELAKQIANAESQSAAV